MKLYVRTIPEGIVDFYNAIALQLGYPDLDAIRYDCTKIEVSEERAEAVEEWYKSLDPDGNEWKYAFGMHWVCSGPKTNKDLHGDEVIIEEGFIYDEPTEEEETA